MEVGERHHSPCREVIAHGSISPFPGKSECTEAAGWFYRPAALSYAGTGIETAAYNGLHGRTASAAKSFEAREYALHMNELYQKEKLLPVAEACSCSGSGCSKSGTQCVEISEPVVLTPTAAVGTLSTTCQGVPEITCETAPDGASCTVTLTQRVCVTIPVNYGVTLTSGQPAIACSGDVCTCK